MKWDEQTENRGLEGHKVELERPLRYTENLNDVRKGPRGPPSLVRWSLSPSSQTLGVPEHP